MKIAKIGIAVLFLVALVGSAFAFYGNSDARQAIENNDYNAWKEAHVNELTEERFSEARQRYQDMEQHREEMDAAIEEGYSAWKALMDENPRGAHMTDEITEDNFDKFVEMHDAMQNGDSETAQNIREELGLNGPGMGPGMGRGMHKEGGMRG